MARLFLDYNLGDNRQEPEFFTELATAIERAKKLHKGQEGFEFMCIRDDKSKILVDEKKVLELLNADKK